MDISASNDLIQALEGAREAGLTRSVLLKGKRKQKEAALAELIDQRRVANLGTDKKPRFVLAEYYKPLELAYAAVEEKATPGKASTFLAKTLAKGTAGAVAAKIPDAIGLLVQEKRLVRIQRGKSVFYLHAASIQSLVNFGAPTAESVPPQSPQSEPGIRRAYEELVRESGFSHVLISDLQRRSGMPLADLKEWLRAESREGRAHPARGDWSLSDADARAAAIEIGGEPHLRIQLV